MLALTRRKNQSIVITVPINSYKVKEIIITVISAREGRTTLGIEAPDDIKIDRKEIYDRKVMESSHEVRKLY